MASLIRRDQEVILRGVDGNSRLPVLLSAQRTACLMSCILAPVLIATEGKQCVLDELLVPTAGPIAITAKVINCQVGCLKVWFRGQTFMLTPLIKKQAFSNIVPAFRNRKTIKFTEEPKKFQKKVGVRWYHFSCRGFL